MHIGTFVFAQIVQFLPQRQFRRIVAKYNDRTKGWSMSHWNHLLVLMFGQLMGCGSLRELTDDRCCRRPIPSETIASLRSSLSTWWLLPNPDVSRRSLNCMADSMPLTPQLDGLVHIRAFGMLCV